ncbi:hypothetical protein UlMin_033894 [Ulmus minor]
MCRSAGLHCDLDVWRPGTSILTSIKLLYFQICSSTIDWPGYVLPFKKKIYIKKKGLWKSDEEKSKEVEKMGFAIPDSPGFRNKTGEVYHSRHLYKVYAVAMVKKMPAYKNRLHALELECNRGSTNKKTAKPSLWELVGVRFILLPCTISKLLLWYGHWSWRYKVKKAPYSWEDASYLTQRALRVPLDAWRNIGDLCFCFLNETRKEDLVQRCLWVQSNLENYMAEMRKESKRRR